jgi:hypothetical protein
MNSLNHYSYGSVVEFLYRDAAGIRPIAPAFRKVRIEPIPEVRLGHLECSYDSVSGLQSGELLPAEITAEAGDDRWLLSVRIRWKDLGMKPAKGDIWHLDINGAGGYWNNPGSDCWTNPSHWGEIIFE